MIAWHPAPRHLKIQGSKGQSVLNRSTYTAAGYVTLKSKIQIKTPRAEIKYHQLYFPISDHDFGDDPLEIWHVAIDAEPRWDAVQAWKSDFTFPRCLNLVQQIEFADRFAKKLNEFGLFVQINIHHSYTTDGGINPHLHATVSERRLTQQGFHSHKSSEVREFFELDKGRLASEFIRDVLNEIGFRDLGEKKITTLETNAERKLPSPEPRLPRRYFKSPKNVQHQEVLQQLVETRKQRHDFIERAFGVSQISSAEEFSDRQTSDPNYQKSNKKSVAENEPSSNEENVTISDYQPDYTPPKNIPSLAGAKPIKSENRSEEFNKHQTVWREEKTQELDKFDEDFGLRSRRSLDMDDLATTGEPVEDNQNNGVTKPMIP
jgi:hypothetical protein